MQAAIDGVSRDFPDGLTILEAARSAGVEIPTLCHDRRLEPLASCRLCMVEIEGREHPAAACTTPLTAGVRVRTRSERLDRARRGELEMLAASVSDAPPRTEFARLLRDYGIEAPAARPERSRPDDSHPYIHVDLGRCIGCFRCVRICADLQGQFVWAVHGRSDATHVAASGGVEFGSSQCVSCGACADTCPSGAIADKCSLDAPEPDAWTRTTCPYCGVGCESEVGTRGGRIAAIRPVLDAPVSKGHLCVKGRYSFGFVHADDRATLPMIRRRGAWERVPWDEAIRFTADRLAQLLRDRGPDSIGVLGSARATNEDNYVAQKFARAVLGGNTVDCCARVCHAPTAAAMKLMLGTGAATNSFDDIERARTIYVHGANATENHPIVGARIRQAALRGAVLIVADPRVTELAAIAAVHMRPRPGTDVALLNAMASAIVAEGLHDAEFAASRVSGWDEYRDFIAAWTPERAAAITGVPAATIREAARAYATSGPSMSVHGLGVTEHEQGSEGVMALVNLALLTGSFGKPGTGVNPLRGQNNVQGSAHMGCEPGHLTGYAPLEGHVERFAAKWGVPLPSRPGLSLMGMLDAAEAGNLAAIWTTGYDILLTNANTAATRHALEKLEFVVVQDLFLNETAAAVGSVFFPAASSYEKDGTFMNAERRVQRVRQAIAPLGESRADWEIVCAVAKAMGKGDLFDFHSAEEIWNEIRSVWPAGAGITYARLEHGGLQWPCPSEDHPGTAILHESSFAGSPRAELRRPGFRPSSESTGAGFPLLLTTGRTLFQFNAGTMTMRTPNVRFRGRDTLDIAPADAERFGLSDGAMAKVSSRWGECTLPVRVDGSALEGVVFATFHSTESYVNNVTGPGRDSYTGTPEYKVAAVRVEPV